jgi:hypothetical protein
LIIGSVRPRTIGGCSNRPMSPGRLAAGAYSGCADAASQSAAGTPRHASAAGRLFAPVGWTRSGPLSTGACGPADLNIRLIGMSRKGRQRPLPARRYPHDPRQVLVEAMHRPTLYRASSSWQANITSSSRRITFGSASRNTSIINSEPRLARGRRQRSGDAGGRVYRVAAGPGDRSESCVETYRSRGQSSAIMHRVYPTANKT